LTEGATIALRAFVAQKNKENYSRISRTPTSYDDVVAVIDTETTADEDLTLKFGSFGIWIGGKLHRFILFYSETLSKKELATLRKHVQGLTVDNVKVELLPLKQFIDKIFYRTVFDDQSLLVGFNLSFDLSRLAIRYGQGKRKWRDGFVFTLSDDRFKPQIRIKSISSTTTFMEFSSPPRRNQRHQRSCYKGRFLDLHTLTFALTNEYLSLEQACEYFQTDPKKIQAKEHGKMTDGYIDYNINDLRATHSLYLKTANRHQQFHLALSPEKAFSPASIGKQYLRQMGIKTFLEQNPDFPPEILGKIMTTYYGGRSEVRIRKKPVKVRYLDFTGMYPSLFSLMDLWPCVIASNIEVVEATEQVRRIVQNASLETLRDQSLWKDFVAIVQVRPEEDILPTRSHYGEKHEYNIGLTYLTSEPLWYALPDVLASKLHTGKLPRILRAIKFVPKWKQADLSEITIVGELTINPQEDLFLKLRQLRMNAQRDQMQIIQKQLKILSNATSYGIFIEVNTEDLESDVDVYGLGPRFECKASKRETFGSFFNPIISTVLTAGARLLLAMAEAWLTRHGAYYTFCDTDSMAVKPFYWRKLQDYFEPLNTLHSDPDFLKLEKENSDEQGTLRELWFYGISAKRYVLFIIDQSGEPVPVKWSSHGLGYLMHNKSNDWEKDLWTNILKYAYGKITKQQLLDIYRNEYAVSRLQITTPNLLRRVKAINKGKRYDQQIKPFNFVLVGSPTMNSGKRPIFPLTNFTDPSLAPFQPFTDAKTGQLYSDMTEAYWKKLDQTIEEYLDHPESKFENGDRSGTMRRRHLKVKSIRYIGKEANELEETEVLGLDDNTYVEYLPPVTDDNKAPSTR